MTSPQVVAVTADGIDNWTLCPRTVKEIESVMSVGPWPPEKDDAPYLCRRWKSTPKTTFSSWADVKTKEKEAATRPEYCYRASHFAAPARADQEPH